MKQDIPTAFTVKYFGLRTQLLADAIVSEFSIDYLLFQRLHAWQKWHNVSEFTFQEYLKDIKTTEYSENAIRFLYPPDKLLEWLEHSESDMHSFEWLDEAAKVDFVDDLQDT